MGGSLSGLEVKVYTSQDAEYAEKFRQGRQPHRCDDRLEDLCNVLTGGFSQLSTNLPVAWRLMRECYKSEVGKEPQDPYVMIKGSTSKQLAAEPSQQHGQHQQPQQQQPEPTDGRRTKR